MRYMYNKLFTKILDSSIWMEPTPTRIVWLTLIAAMDEHGLAQFASIHNLAHRAVLSVPEAEAAVKTLEGPDPNSSDPDNEGRRIERIDGGWIVLNAQKYRELVTRSVAQERTRLRVARHRDKKRGNAPVTVVTPELRSSNGHVTQSDSGSVSESVSGSDSREEGKVKGAAGQPTQSGGFNDQNRRPYPESEDQMYDILEKEEVGPWPDHDGHFYEQMVGKGWRQNGKLIADWVQFYHARCLKTVPELQ